MAYRTCAMHVLQHRMELWTAYGMLTSDSVGVSGCWPLQPRWIMMSSNCMPISYATAARHSMNSLKPRRREPAERWRTMMTSMAVVDRRPARGADTEAETEARGGECVRVCVRVCVCKGRHEGLMGTSQWAHLAGWDQSHLLTNYDIPYQNYNIALL